MQHSDNTLKCRVYTFLFCNNSVLWSESKWSEYWKCREKKQKKTFPLCAGTIGGYLSHEKKAWKKLKLKYRIQVQVKWQKWRKPPVSNIHFMLQAHTISSGVCALVCMQCIWVNSTKRGVGELEGRIRRALTSGQPVPELRGALPSCSNTCREKLKSWNDQVIREKK